MIGANRRDLRKETVFEAAMIIAHPNYTEFISNKYDIGLIKVAPCIPLTGTTRKVCLPEAGMDFMDQYCVTPGFGRSK